MHNTGHFSHPGRPGHPGKPHHPGHPDCLVTLVILTTVVTLFQCKGRTCQVQLGLVYSGLPQVMLVHPTSEVRPPPALKRSGTVPAGSTGGHQGISWHCKSPGNITCLFVPAYQRVKLYRVQSTKWEASFVLWLKLKSNREQSSWGGKDVCAPEKAFPLPGKQSKQPSASSE